MRQLLLRLYRHKPPFAQARNPLRQRIKLQLQLNLADCGEKRSSKAGQRVDGGVSKSHRTGGAG
jgi:hypothetical protein